ncbi:YfhO family protein [Flavobacterium subsaxonicum]|uniref:Membrane protein n=1 Tax=Flavobacterium subsaxonicum WB 4.1-42 = DSM 21790 TaxID=1121898 RepID=A0A0A2MSK3_9FLAO|nr:YfhO family protein [Flavobacterium subsaxonicum]KGO94581.1 membrane protein [Flavobacterium subsaxonicum WB 4.1-42 = DSM 21790]
MKNINKLYPYFLAVIGFVIVSLIYFYPVLQGKKIYQSDIVQYTGMAKEQNDFRKATGGDEPYWTNSAFGGMPTYQLGANYPHNYIKKIDGVLRFLPRPADYLFLYFIGFFVLLRVLKIDPLKAFFGALAFGFSTYLVIILGVGHNAKAHAIAYMPLVVAGVILVFRRKYVVGGLLTLLAAALEINANHFQMTYYLLLLVLVIGAYFIIEIVKNKEYRHLGLAVATFAISGLVALGLNATSLMATSEYTKASIRNKSDLTYNADGSANTTESSMEYDYITEYSYGVTESLDLIIPRMFGGGNRENVGTNSAMYEFILAQGASPQEAEQFVSNVPTYWGDQPIVEAPAYIGAIVFFLAVLVFFTDNRKIKYAFLAGALLSLLLSWGKNFPALTNIFIDYVPLYDKFRAVSSIQVILELCMPALAFMGLQSFFKLEAGEQFKALWKTAAIALGLIVLLFVFKGSFSFAGGRDASYLQAYGEVGPVFVEALREQRMEMYSADLWRSALFILIAAGALWGANKNKLSVNTAVIIIGIALVADLAIIDRNYVNTKNFVSAREADSPFKPTQADEFILRDTSNYRVYELQGRLAGRTSYFHKAVGGYSAVRPRKADQLFLYQVEPKFQDIIKGLNHETMSLGKSVAALDMLNVKYILVQAQDGQDVPVTNPYVNGNAWFVSKVKAVSTADEEMKALGTLDSKNEAIINKTNFAQDAAPATFTVDSTATIQLNSYKPNHLKYTSNNKNNGLAVFSEIYYASGWNAYIDGKLTPHFEADYLLRGLKIPAGKHIVEFKFEPQVVKTGSTIALVSFIAMLLLLGAGIYFENKKSKEQPQKA